MLAICLPRPLSRLAGIFADKTAAAIVWAALAIVLALMSTPASAGTLATWTGGGGSGDWGTASNWNPAVNAPTTSGTYSLIFGGVTQTTSTNTLGTVNVDLLSFTNSGTLAPNQNSFFKLYGGTLAFTSGTITTTAASGSPFTNNSDGDFIYNPITVSGTLSVISNNLHNVSLGGNISGTGTLLCDDGSVGTTEYVYLSGSNTYSGGTLIRGGYVQTAARVDETTGLATTSNNFALGTGPVTVSDNGTLLVRNSSIVTNPLTISGSSAGGSGSLTGSFGVAGQTAEYRGNITVVGDTRFSTSTAITTDSTSKFVISGNVDLTNSLLTLRSQRGSAVNTGLLIEMTGTIVGAGGINIQSNGAWGRVLISGSNSYSGGTTVTTGSLTVGSSTALGNGFLAVNTSGLDLNGQSLLVGALSGSSTGVIEAGIGGSSSLRSTSTANTTYAGTIRDGAGSVNFGLAGSGTLTFTGSNTYTGTTAIDGGVLVMGSADALAGGGTIDFGGGTLRYTGVNTLDYSARIKNSGSAVSIDTNGESVTFASAIDSSNIGGLEKLGLGVLYLNAANAFTGPTTVAAGTLSGTGSVLGAFSVQSGAVFDPGASPTATTVFGVGSFSQATGGTTKMQVNGTTAGSLYDQVAFSGTSKTVSWGGTLDLTLSGSYANYTQFNLFDGFTSQSGNLAGIQFAAPGSPYSALSFTGPVGGVWYTDYNGSGQYMTFNQNTGVLMVVPEPGAFIVAGMGLTALGLRSLRRRRRAAA